MTDATEAPTETLRACPLCGGASWRPLPVPGRWIGPEVFADLRGKIGLVRCRGCGLVFSNPRPSAGRLGRFYAGDTYCCHDEAGSMSAGAKADHVLAQITKYLPPDAPRTLLDYGAGGGGFLAHARSRGWQVRGFEPGARGLETCRRLGLDATDRVADLPRAAFGLITLHHVFEHVADPRAVLDDLRTLLAPGGRLYLEVPNAGSLRARLALPALSRRTRVEERYPAYPIHLMYYSGRTLRAMLARAGWRTEKTLTIGMGVGDYLRPRSGGHPRPPADPGAAPAAAAPTAPAAPPKRRWRHALRDGFLGLGLGENLGAIARPDGP